MKWKTYLPYLVSVLIAFGVGGVGALATSRGLAAYEQLVKPALTPPALVFPIVWTILYLLMGVGAALVWRSAHSLRGPALTVYAAQLLLNGLWSILFFGLQAHLPAFLLLVLLWLLIIAMVVLFRRIEPAAGYLQLPYLLWVTFAGYLNLGIWLLNR